MYGKPPRRGSVGKSRKISNECLDLLLRHGHRVLLVRATALRSQQEEAELPPPVVGRRDDEHHHLRIAPVRLLHLHRAKDEHRVGNPFVLDLRSCLGLDRLFLVIFCLCSD